jgi:hypothetical protein
VLLLVHFKNENSLQNVFPVNDRFEVLKLFLFQNLEFFFAIYNFPKIRGCKQGDLLIFGQKYKMLSNIKYLYAS